MRNRGSRGSRGGPGGPGPGGFRGRSRGSRGHSGRKNTQKEKRFEAVWPNHPGFCAGRSSRTNGSGYPLSAPAAAIFSTNTLTPPMFFIISPHRRNQKSPRSQSPDTKSWEGGKPTCLCRNPDASLFWCLDPGRSDPLPPIMNSVQPPIMNMAFLIHGAFITRVAGVCYWGEGMIYVILKRLARWPCE